MIEIFDETYNDPPGGVHVLLLPSEFFVRNRIRQEYSPAVGLLIGLQLICEGTDVRGEPQRICKTVVGRHITDIAVVCGKQIRSERRHGLALRPDDAVTEPDITDGLGSGITCPEASCVERADGDRAGTHGNHTVLIVKTQL